MRRQDDARNQKKCPHGHASSVLRPGRQSGVLFLVLQAGDALFVTHWVTLHHHRELQWVQWWDIDKSEEQRPVARAGHSVLLVYSTHSGGGWRVSEKSPAL